jgi:hypothetical protein
MAKKLTLLQRTFRLQEKPPVQKRTLQTFNFFNFFSVFVWDNFGLLGSGSADPFESGSENVAMDHDIMHGRPG